jgi:lipid A ethanolaminephosphotransferase
VALAIYFTLTLNTAFWSTLHSGLSVQTTQIDYFTFFTVGLGITAFNAALLSLFLWGKKTQPVGAFFMVLTAALHYFSQQYSTVYNPSMITNIVSTDWHEAHEYMGWPVASHILLFGALPAIILLTFFRVENPGTKKLLTQKISFIASMLVTTGLCIAANYATLAAVSRNTITLRHSILPASAIFSTLRVTASGAASQGEARNLPLDTAARRAVDPNARPLLFVVVVGETVRAANWQLSGYERTTTPRLASLPRNTLFTAPYAQSCGTSTEVSVPCMFSPLGRRLYDRREITRTESVVEMLGRIGVQTYWIDNQSGCKGVCDGLSTSAESEKLRQSLTLPNGYDDWLIEAASTVSAQATSDALIVLHTLGNHGPAYYLRYPATSATFNPTCTDPSFKTCSREEIENAYDNAIRHTDDVLFRTISWLKTIKTHDVALIYVSDHGESLGEAGLYLHGLPYMIAPNTQKRVPFMLWIPEDVQQRRGIDAKCTSQRFSNVLSHDNLPHSLMGVFDVKSSVYEESLDLFSRCHE